MCTCLLTIFCTILSLFKHIGIWQSITGHGCAVHILICLWFYHMNVNQ